MFLLGQLQTRAQRTLSRRPAQAIEVAFQSLNVTHQKKPIAYQVNGGAAL